MLFSLKVIFFGSIYLLILNYFQIKKNFLLDKITKMEVHKALLNTETKIPLSGISYFLPIILFLLYQSHFNLTLFCIIFFIIGIFSDSKILGSPKLRLFSQFLILLIFLIMNDQVIIDTRIQFLNSLLGNEILRIFIISFFFLVLINGFNFIDGVNNLCSLNFLIVLIFLLFLSVDLNIKIFNKEIYSLILFLFVFVIFNFFGKNFLGDSGVYGLSFLIGYISIVYTSSEIKISPYFIANLLWYPAFENLFSIIRRSIVNKKNYLPDNEHLHQLLFKYLNSKNWIKKKYLLSSLTGILINFYLFIGYLIGYSNYSETYFQVIIIFINVTIYLFMYYLLKNKFNV